MKFIVELLCLMLAISSCNTKTFHNNSSNLNDTINSDQSNRMDTVHQIENNFSNKKKIIYTDTLPFSADDTFNKYAGDDTLYGYRMQAFFVGRMNNVNYGIVYKKDLTLIYQKENNHWMVTDSIPKNCMGRVEYADLNGDNYNDLIIITGISAAGGNRENYILLFNPQKNKFKHNEYYDLLNIQYDKNKNMVETFWNGTIHGGSKSIYKITGDSLTFIETVYFHHPEIKADEDYTIDFYEGVNGKGILKNSITGNWEKIYEMYKNELFPLPYE